MCGLNVECCMGSAEGAASSFSSLAPGSPRPSREEKASRPRR